MLIDELLANNEAFARSGFPGEMPAPPTRRLAVVACMDARMDVYKILGLAEGEAHVIRNAGGIVTDDVLRSLIVSQHVLGTEEVVLLHHSACGMVGLDEDALKQKLRDGTGQEVGLELGSIDDLDASVRDAKRALLDNPFLRSVTVRGFVYDVTTGLLREVE